MHKNRKRQISLLKLERIDVKKYSNSKYDCLKQMSDMEDHWRSLLQNQLEMKSTVVAFQQIEVSMRVDAHKKLLLRETFKLKKEIRKEIQSENYPVLLDKIRILALKSPSDQNLANQFLALFQIRQDILKDDLAYRKERISQIKQKLKMRIDREDLGVSTLEGKILFILSLHLIKINGILIQKKQIHLIIQGLNNKKKELNSSENDLKVTLECLLFITFEFYKILYRTKADQDLIMSHFNQMQAYLSIYTKYFESHNSFENKFKIREKLQEMKPLTLNLKIYADHDRRRVLSLQNIKQSIIKNHHNLGNIKIKKLQPLEKKNQLEIKRPARRSFNMGDTSNEKIEECCSSRLNDSEITLMREIISMISNQKQSIQTLSNKFSFSFIKPHQSTILLGHFKTQLNCGSFTISVSIFMHECMIGRFTIGPIELQDRQSIGDFAKKLWRVVKDKFYTDKTQFLPNLFSFDYPPFSILPSHINTTSELPIIVRVHEILLHYMRKQEIIQKMNGAVVKFPTKDRENEDNYRKGRGEGQSKNPEEKIFSKRHGFISFNKKVKNIRNVHKKGFGKQDHSHIHFYDHQEHGELSLVMFVNEDCQSFSILYCVIDNIQNKVKAIIVESVVSKLIKFERTFRLDLQSHLQTMNCKWRRNKISMIIQLMQMSQNDLLLESYNSIESSNSRMRAFYEKREKKQIQEEFEVMKSPVLQTKSNIIKAYKRGFLQPPTRQIYNKKSKFLNSLVPASWKVFQVNHKYVLFREQIYSSYAKYYNQKTEFYLSSENYSLQIWACKLRIYKTIYFLVDPKSSQKKQQYQKYYCKRMKNFSHEPVPLSKKECKTDLKWIRTKIITSEARKNKKKYYYYLDIFAQKEKQILTIYSFRTGRKYGGFYNDEFAHLKNWTFHEKKLLLNGFLLLRENKAHPHSLCDAQQFLQSLQ